MNYEKYIRNTNRKMVFIFAQIFNIPRFFRERHIKEIKSIIELKIYLPSYANLALIDYNSPIVALIKISYTLPMLKMHFVQYTFTYNQNLTKLSEFDISLSFKSGLFFKQFA